MGPRLMYWPNEPAHLYPDFTQAGGRAAFADMVADGTLADLEVYSYQVERAKFSNVTEFEFAALKTVENFKPDILFVQHVSNTDLTSELWSSIKRVAPGVTLVYHDDDAFGRWIKRVDRPTSAVATAADLVLISGLGELARRLERHGARTIGYMPSCFVASRFAQADPSHVEKTHDVVMVGTNGRLQRVPWLYVPGGRRRAELARTLSETFGARFALYGKGWSGLQGSRGMLPFFEQERAIQCARISVNWDHFDTLEYYFSDRLPISLAAGVPHVTTYHPGYERVFAGCPGLYPCRTPAEALDACRWLLSRDDGTLLAEGLAARQWVHDRLEAAFVFRSALEQTLRIRRSS